MKNYNVTIRRIESFAKKYKSEGSLLEIHLFREYQNRKPIIWGNEVEKKGEDYVSKGELDDEALLEKLKKRKLSPNMPLKDLMDVYCRFRKDEALQGLIKEEKSLERVINKAINKEYPDGWAVTLVSHNVMMLRHYLRELQAYAGMVGEEGISNRDIQERIKPNAIKTFDILMNGLNEIKTGETKVRSIISELEHTLPFVGYSIEQINKKIDEYNVRGILEKNLENQMPRMLEGHKEGWEKSSREKKRTKSNLKKKVIPGFGVVERVGRTDEEFEQYLREKGFGFILDYKE